MWQKVRQKTADKYLSAKIRSTDKDICSPCTPHIKASLMFSSFRLSAQLQRQLCLKSPFQTFKMYLTKIENNRRFRHQLITIKYEWYGDIYVKAWQLLRTFWTNKLLEWKKSYFKFVNRRLSYSRSFFIYF